MNPADLGDSYDMVKRFFCDTARSLGYAVYIDPMDTGTWTRGQSRSFLRFLDAGAIDATVDTSSAALFIHPDKGLRARTSAAHVTFAAVAARCHQFRLVIVFDQSFSRRRTVREDMIRKLRALRALGVRGVYFDSHTPFLICGTKPAPVMRFQKALTNTGLPADRFVGLPASAHKPS